MSLIDHVRRALSSQDVARMITLGLLSWAMARLTHETSEIVESLGNVEELRRDVEELRAARDAARAELDSLSERLVVSTRALALASSVTKDQDQGVEVIGPDAG